MWKPNKNLATCILNFLGTREVEQFSGFFFGTAALSLHNWQIIPGFCIDTFDLRELTAIRSDIATFLHPKDGYSSSPACVNRQPGNRSYTGRWFPAAILFKLQFLVDLRLVTPS